MERTTVINFFVKMVLVFYVLFVAHMLLSSFLSDMYSNSLYASVVGWLFNHLVGICFLLSLALITLHVTSIFRIKRKIFISLLGLFLVHLFLGYLEIRKHGW